MTVSFSYQIVHLMTYGIGIVRCCQKSKKVVHIYASPENYFHDLRDKMRNLRVGQTKRRATHESECDKL